MTATNPRVWVRELTFSNVTTIVLERNDIVVIVGANNAGKSTTLRDIYSHLRTPDINAKAVTKVEFAHAGTSDDVHEWLTNTCTMAAAPSGTNYFGLNVSVSSHNVDHWWKEASTQGLHDLRGFFSILADTAQRLAITTPAPNNVNILTGTPNHPAQYLLADDTIELDLSDAFNGAFGTDLILHRGAGANLPFLIGTRPPIAAGEDRVSASYLRKLKDVPFLHEQGDGMKGFAGVLLMSTVRQYSLLLIDEPSVFLHPPQSRTLGRSLIENAAEDCQTMSTHDGDFLRGMLDVSSSRVKVIRLQRDEDKNAPSLLSNEEIATIWGDSLLRYSNILDGLFHELVVICESDSDALFYSAISNVAFTDKGRRKPDTMFVHGAARIGCPS